MEYNQKNVKMNQIQEFKGKKDKIKTKFTLMTTILLQYFRFPWQLPNLTKTRHIKVG
jgi:hypothetical protein